jgi:hypothetical protein
MDRADLANYVTNMLVGAQRHPLGMAGLMIESEINAGHQPVQPGCVSPFAFPLTDWPFPQVISLDGSEVRLVAIRASNPGSGALSRLIEAIQDAGLRPVIVAPVGSAMPAILRHWGWRWRVVGRGWEQVEEWRPRTRASG